MSDLPGVVTVIPEPSDGDPGGEGAGGGIGRGGADTPRKVGAGLEFIWAILQAFQQGSNDTGGDEEETEYQDWYECVGHESLEYCQANYNPFP